MFLEGRKNAVCQNQQSLPSLLFTVIRNDNQLALAQRTDFLVLVCEINLEENLSLC